MSERSVEHGTIVIERRYPAPPERTFAAWADAAAKARWLGVPDGELELDFRVGGEESHNGTLPDGRVYTYQGVYQDIVPPRRILYTYEMLLDDSRISISLATAEFTPEHDGTRLVYTEQGAFLDGHEPPARRDEGMGSLLDALGKELQIREIAERVVEAKRVAEEKRLAAERAAETARREAEEREQQWHALMARAKARLVETHRADQLHAQADAWHQADGLRRYCDALDAARGDNAVTAEWLAWARAYAASLDPLTEPPTMPEPPEPSPEALQDHLPHGWSAHGPHNNHDNSPLTARYAL